jgi:predicted nucleotidyltransferase
MDVIPVARARAGLSEILRRFRADADAEPVIVGSHRKPEAVLVPFAQYRAGSASAVVDLARVRARAPLIRRLAAASGLSDVRVFGSVARGDQTEMSDVDLLVTPGAEASLFDLAQFEMDAELLLGRIVHVVSANALDAQADAQILREALPL